MRNFVLVNCLLLLIIPFRSIAGIEFRNLTISQAIQIAEKEHKLVLVDFFADACPPCKYMEKNVFTDSRLGDLVNKNFIAIRSHSGNIEGKKEQAKYRIDLLPTLLILDPFNGELNRLRGKKELPIVIEFLEKSLKGEYINNPPPQPQNQELPPKPKPAIKTKDPDV